MKDGVMHKSINKNIFSFRNFDGHYVLIFFKFIKISFRHKSDFPYKEVTEYGLTTEKRTPQLIVSLTSYPARIQTVHKVISTILQQTLKADRVVLWLAEEQFPNRELDLPQNLLDLQKFGLEIKWCENIMSFKKLIPSLREFPEDIIVTADDDLYYEKDWLKSLYNAYLENPKHIYVRRVARLYFDKDGKIEKYPSKNRMFEDFPNPSYLSSPFGGSGCLYPPHCLSSNVFDIETATKLTKSHDDLWFWAMAVLNDTKFCEVGGITKPFYYLDETIETGLAKTQNYNADFSLSVYKKLMEHFQRIKQNIDSELKPIKKLSVVIPTLQKDVSTLTNLVSTLTNDEIVDEILIIDNSLKGYHFDNKKVRVITPRENLFVNPSWNLGVQEAKNEYICLANDDIKIPKNYCSMLIKQMSDKYGIIGISTEDVIDTRNSDNEVIIDISSVETEKVNNLTFRPITFRPHNYGTLMFFKKENYVPIPEDLKIFFGDDWIIYQAKKLGKANVIVCGAKIYHLGSMTSSSFSGFASKEKKKYLDHIIPKYRRIFCHFETCTHKVWFILGLLISVRKRGKYEQ